MDFCCVIGVCNKYAQVHALKDEKGISNTNSFQTILDKPNRCIGKSKGRKPEKIRLDNVANFV